MVNCTYKALYKHFHSTPKSFTIGLTFTHSFIHSHNNGGCCRSIPLGAMQGQVSCPRKRQKKKKVQNCFFVFFQDIQTDEDKQPFPEAKLAMRC